MIDLQLRLLTESDGDMSAAHNPAAGHVPTKHFETTTTHRSAQPLEGIYVNPDQ
jgi:hypothetical protein